MTGIPVTGVNELVLEVQDRLAAERFYAGILGLPVVERWPDRDATWLMAGKRTRIGLWAPQVGVAGGRGGAHVHFALHISNRHFDAAVRRLRAFGLEPQIETHGGGLTRSRSAYVDDPDGNCVELWTRRVARYRRRSGAFPPTEHELSSAELFHRSAADWDANYDESSMRGHRWKARLSATLKLVGRGPGDLLEVGFGSGRALGPLGEQGWTVSGVDPAPAMLERARDRAPAAADRLILGRAEELPFADDSFDVVVAVGALEYTDMERSVPEIARVLRPGGRAIICLRNGRSPSEIWRWKVVHPVARAVKARVKIGSRPPQRRRPTLSRKRASRVLANAGLTVRSSKKLGCEVVPDPFDRAVPGLARRAAQAAERSAALRAL